MKIIELYKDFGSFSVEVKGLDLTEGRIHGLIGPNGCGKTTFAKLISGILPADKIVLDWEGLSAREMTMTSQKPYMLQDTVYKNLVYPLRLRGVKKPDSVLVSRWLKFCGLEGHETARAKNLSSGQQQKLSIARALIFAPRFIIIDESLSNLDLDSLEIFQQEILRIQKEDPVTWLIVSHQMPHLRRLCDEIHFMDKGRILISGTPDKMLKKPDTPELERFLRLET